jgi:hypothetical protein
LGQPEAAAVKVTAVPDAAVPEGAAVKLTPVQGGWVVVSTYVLLLYASHEPEKLLDRPALLASRALAEMANVPAG